MSQSPFSGVVRRLPPGQKARIDFPRFGLPPYADRFPTNITEQSIVVEVNGNGPFKIDVVSAELPRTTIQADFHCVTSWSCIGVNWGGVRFVDFYEKHIRHLETEDNCITGAVIYAQDGYKTTLLIEDLLGEDVLLADTFDGQPLSIEHGAPLRLVVPEHYGYKNLKYLSKMKFYSKLPVLKRGVQAFLDHPRARVRKEERGRWIPGWILRFVYRPFISSTVKNFRKAMQRYRSADV